MKQFTSRHSFIFIILLLACNSQESQSIINVFTSEISVEENSVRISGSYKNTIIDIDYSGNISSRSIDISDHGHCWATDSIPTLSNNLISYGPTANIDTFYTEINNLEYNATYFSRAFIIVDNTIYYGNTIEFSIDEKEEEEEEPETPETPEEPVEVKELWTEERVFARQKNTTTQGFKAGNSLYVGLTSANDQDENRLFWKYNTNNNSWTKIESFNGIAVTNAIMVSYNQKGYLVGGNRVGFFQVPTDQLYEYDIEENEWDKLRKFKGRARRFATGFRWRNYIIYGLGENQDDLWAYNIDRNRWDELETEIPKDLEDREDAISFTYADKAYIGFGKDKDYKKDLWCFEPENNRWKKQKQFPGSGRIIKCVFVIENNAYFVSGFNGNSIAENWKYNIIADTWEKVDDDFELLDKVAFGLSINNQGYGIIDYEKSFWSFKPNND